MLVMSLSRPLPLYRCLCDVSHVRKSGGECFFGEPRKTRAMMRSGPVMDGGSDSFRIGARGKRFSGRVLPRALI